MDRIAHISLQTNQRPTAHAERLDRLRLQLAADTAFGDVSPLRPDEGPAFMIVLPDALDEAEAAARINGAGFTCAIRPDELHVQYAMLDLPRPSAETILRLAIDGPLDLDQRNDEYERLKVISAFIGWPFLGGHMSRDRVHADLLVPTPTTLRGVGQLLRTLASAAAAHDADPDRVLVQVFAGDAPRHEGLYARLQIAPAPIGQPWGLLRAQLLAELGRLGWAEEGRATGRGQMTLILRAPHRDGLRAGREIAAALAATPEGPARVDARLLSRAEALAELNAQPRPPAPPAPPMAEVASAALQESLYHPGGDEAVRRLRYTPGPILTPAGPVVVSDDGWLASLADGQMLDGRTYGFIRSQPQLGATIIEWASGHRVTLTEQALRDLALVIPRGQ